MKAAPPRWVLYVMLHFKRLLMSKVARWPVYAYVLNGVFEHHLVTNPILESIPQYIRDNGF